MKIIIETITPKSGGPSPYLYVEEDPSKETDIEYGRQDSFV